MTDVLRIAHPQDCPLEGNLEVGNPEIYRAQTPKYIAPTVGHRKT